ncbi:ABC transporter ATP-binding protein [Streptomyces sp. enrichment culture]|uniref:ABC transporter ATP-binding protein n=1 Tax=Streptomyces sp. enrichment culture TaxID=1795815 RepID=UPI003F54C692
MGDSLLQLRGIEKTFTRPSGGEGMQVIRGISLTINDRQRHAIVGKSGAGKSTLLSVIGLLDRPDKGIYEIHGRDTASMRDAELSRLRGAFFGFVYQRFFLLPHLTALENVEMALSHGTYMRRRERRVAATEALARVGLHGRLRHYPSQLSGGEQQRVAIARAVAHRPKVVLADEPTGALDEDTARSAIEWLVELCDSGRSSLIVVTHDNRVAQSMEFIHHLSHGKWV